MIKGKVKFFLIVITMLLLLFFDIFKFNSYANVLNKIANPNRIKIYCSDNVITIDTNHKRYEEILRLNKKRLINPLTKATIDITNISTFVSSKNKLQLSSKYNYSHMYKISEYDLTRLKKNIDMIEYLYEEPVEINFNYSRYYDDSDKFNINVEEKYTRILFTVTEGDYDLMFFGEERLLYYYPHGYVLKTSKELTNVIKEVTN